MKLTIYIHSFVDLITNSSTEIYIQTTDKTVEMVKNLVNAVLEMEGSVFSCDDLFSITAEGGDAYSPNKLHVVVINDNASKYVKAVAAAITNINGAFQTQEFAN